MGRPAAARRQPTPSRRPTAPPPPSTTAPALLLRDHVEQRRRAARPGPSRWCRRALPDSLVFAEMLRGLGLVGRRHRATTRTDWSCGRRASRRGELEVRACGWGCRSSACADQAGHNHAGTLRRRAGSAHLFAAGAAPCARGRAPTQRCLPAARRAHRSPIQRLNPHAAGTDWAVQRLARPMPVAAAAARWRRGLLQRVRHAREVRGLTLVVIKNRRK